MSDGQGQLSTRALEIATAANARLEQHMKEHERRDQERSTVWSELRDEMKGMRKDLTATVGRVHTRIDEIKTANSTLRLKIAGIIIGTLFLILGAIIMKGLPWQ